METTKKSRETDRYGLQDRDRYRGREKQRKRETEREPLSED